MNVTASHFAVDLATKVNAVLAEAVRGERQLRHKALMSFLRSDGVAGVHLMGKVSFDLHLFKGSQEDTGFLWFRKSSEKPLFEISLGFLLAPDDDVLPPPLRPVAHQYLLPGFLDRNSAAGELCFRSGAEVYTVRFSEDREIRENHVVVGMDVMTVTSGAGEIDRFSTAADSTASTGGRLDARTLTWLMPLLSEIAAWRRAGRPGRECALSIPDADVLRWLFESVVKGFTMMEVRHDTIENGPFHGPLHGDQTLIRSTASARFYLDQSVRLIEARHTRACQQLDMHLTRDDALGDGLTHISFDLPDFLVDGAIHSRIVDAMREQASTGKLLSAFRSADYPDRSLPNQVELEDYLSERKTDEAALVIRTGQDLTQVKGSDTDLVLIHARLRGQPLRTMWMINLDRTSDGLGFIMANVQLLAWQSKGNTWETGTATTDIHRYLIRLCKVLACLQGAAQRRAP